MWLRAGVDCVDKSYESVVKLASVRSAFFAPTGFIKSDLRRQHAVGRHFR